MKDCIAEISNGIQQVFISSVCSGQGAALAARFSEGG